MNDQQAKDHSIWAAQSRKRWARRELVKIVKRWSRVYIRKHGWAWVLNDEMTQEFRECLNKIISSAYRKRLHRWTSTLPSRIIKMLLDNAHGQL